MRKCFLLFFLLFSFCDGFAQPTLSLDWQDKRPNSIGRLIKHDSQRNIITCGNIHTTHYNLLLIKQNEAGTQLWSQTYIDGAGGNMKALDMLLDSADNIYIAGIAHEGIFSDDTEGFIAKYNSLGNLQWIRFYGWQDSLSGGFNKLKMFNNQYLYITGSFDYLGGFGSYKAILVKYDLSGNLIWDFKESLQYSKMGVSNEVDKNGNIYLIGYTDCCPQFARAFAAKFDSLGNRKWETVLIDTVYVEGFARTSAIDDSANIYVGFDASVIGFATRYDAGFAKLDSSGNLKWVTAYDNNQSVHTDELVSGVRFDKSYNSYVYGYFSSNLPGAYGLCYIAKYNNTGILSWVHNTDSFGLPYGFGISGCYFLNDSNLIIAGQGFVVSSLNISGTINWTQILSAASYYCSSEDFFDSTIVFTGYSEPNTSTPDSLVICKIKIDFISGVTSNIKNNPESSLVFPNPFNDRIFISKSTTTLHKLNIKIYNSLGEQVYDNRALQSFSELNTSMFAKGIYLMEIDDGINLSRRKIIKQ